MNKDRSRENVLYAFAVETHHDRETLDRYIAQYPDLKSELTELAWELRISEDDLDMAPELIDDPGLNSAWNTFQAAGAASSQSINPFSQFQGKRFASLCKSLGLPKAFVVAIRNRQVEFESIPERFLVAASTALGATLEDLKTFLRKSPNVAGALEFKADKKPQIAGKVTFQELIESTELTDQERTTAAGYLDHDRSD